MPRVSPNTSGGPVLKAIQAELVIQYSGIRATELKQTAQRDRQDQDDIQRRKTKEDLNALKITLNNFHPLRFIFVWKRGRVRVMWRLKEGSRVHRQLSYLVRNAHDNMQDILCELDIEKLTWREDLKPILMSSLPAAPWAAERRNNMRTELSPYSKIQARDRSCSINEDTNITVLPALAVTMSDGNIQFIKTTRPKDTYPWREWIPEESTVGTPQQSIASEAPGHNSVHADTRSYWPEIELNPGSEIAGIDHDTALVLPTASPVPLFPAAHEPTRIEEQHISSVVSRDLSEDCTLVSEEPQEKSATTSSDVYSAQKISNCHSAPQDIYCVSLSSDSPTPNDRSEVHILRELLVDEMCRRKELESVIEAQRRVTDDFIARHEMQIQVIGRALDTTENMKNALEAQLLESQSTVLQLQMTVNECRAELVAIQNALKVEQGERARVDAMLEEIRRERENPAVPALATALSMINGLTSQALDK